MKPKLTIILPVFNAKKDLQRFFPSLQKQSFPKKELEVLVMDGGSTDGTIELSRRYGATVVHNPDKLAEPGIWHGCARAKAPLVMILAADIAFPNANTIKTIVDVFKNKKIVAAFPKFLSAPGDNIYSRYYNAFSEPFTHFVYGNATNYTTFYKVYPTISHTNTYDIYDYAARSTYPGLGFAHGFTIQKKDIPVRKEKSDDFLVIYSLIKRKAQIAYVYAAPIYHYVIRDFKQFIFKERRSVENALLRGDSGITVRTAYLTPTQRLFMYLYLPYAFSLVIPLLRSLINAVRYKEAAWLVHWYMTLCSAFIICWMIVVVTIQKLFRKV